MPKTIAFLSDAPGAMSWEQQESAIALPGDVVFQAQKTGLHELHLRLRLQGLDLEAGDTIKIYDLGCVPLPTPKLLRTLSKLMNLGVNIKFVKPGIHLSAVGGQKVMGPFLEAISKHESNLKKAKEKGTGKSRIGRPPALSAAQAIEIERKIAAGSSVTEVAKAYQVSRSAVYDALQRSKTRSQSAKA